MKNADESPRLETIELTGTQGRLPPNVPVDGSPGPRQAAEGRRKPQRGSTWLHLHGDSGNETAAKLTTAKYREHLHEYDSSWVPSQRKLHEPGSEKSEPLCLVGHRPTYLITRNVSAGLCAWNLDECIDSKPLQTNGSTAMPWAMCACEVHCGPEKDHWCEHGLLMASGHSDGTLAIWSISHLSLVARFAGPAFDRGKIFCMSAVRSSGMLLTGSSTSWLRVWQFSDKCASGMNEVHSVNTAAGGEVWACCAVHIGDGSDVFVSCHSSGLVMLWSSETYAQLGQIEMHFQDHESAYCAAQSDRLVVNSSVGVRVFR